MPQTLNHAVRAGALSAALLLAGSSGALGQLDPLPVAPEPPAAQETAPTAPTDGTDATLVEGHPVAATGWARAIVPAVVLQSDPAPSAFGLTTAPGRRVAGEVVEVRRDVEGGTWVYLRYPGGQAGWAPLNDLRPVPAPAPPSARLQASLDRYLAKISGRVGVEIRDEYGRPFYSYGTDRPLVLASVTKLFTVGAALESQPLGSEARRILAPSNNYRAQLLIERVGDGSNRRGTRAAEEYAASLGADVQLADGSGLSSGNRASAPEVVDFLIGIRERERFAQLRGGLPIAGRSGTLRSRMRRTAAEGRVRAKTGTLFTPSVSTLAGYTWPTKAGSGPNRVLTFAILLNGYDYTRGRGVQDRVLRMVVSRTR